ncbi:hypothetical protein L7F22_067516 [Adiantum nelumboides]|nr:hypothetical protein [Adiantum nelumboides]
MVGPRRRPCDFIKHSQESQPAALTRDVSSDSLLSRSPRYELRFYLCKFSRKRIGQESSSISCIFRSVVALASRWSLSALLMELALSTSQIVFSTIIKSILRVTRSIPPVMISFSYGNRQYDDCRMGVHVDDHEGNPECDLDDCYSDVEDHDLSNLCRGFYNSGGMIQLDCSC